ncbi:MAG TPA: hypothetical protein VF669_10245, partial [Tepidisphaeraceae bacterium]
MRTFLLTPSMIQLRLAIIVTLLLACSCKQKPSPAPTTNPTTAPATQAAKPPTTNYVDLLRQRHPRLATTQPLDIPLDLPDAGHFIIETPVYLDPRGDLWFTHPDAPETPDVIQSAVDKQTHLTREHLLFVHWHVNEKNKFEPTLISRAESGAIEIVTPKSRTRLHSTTQPSTQPAPADYDFTRAQSWTEDKIIVPTSRGLSIITLHPELSESHHDLVARTPENPVQFTFDTEGILAWIPTEAGHPGSAGAARFVNNTWTTLDSKSGWPDKIVHLVPLLDGSILQLIAASDETITLNLTPLTSTHVDEATITDLVKQMADPDPAKRKGAFEELQRYGNASWPILEKLQTKQPLEARLKIKQLLANRLQPTVGGYTLVQNKARVAARLSDGGIVLQAPSGVSMPQEDGSITTINTAWISIRPGSPIQLLEDVLVRDANPDQDHLYAFGDEWVLSTDEQGPQR